MIQTLIREGSEPLVAMLSSGGSYSNHPSPAKTWHQGIPSNKSPISKLFLLIPRMQQQPYLLMRIRVVYSATLHLYAVLVSLTPVTLVTPFTSPQYWHWEGWEQVTSSCPASWLLSLWFYSRVSLVGIHIWYNNPHTLGPLEVLLSIASSPILQSCCIQTPDPAAKPRATAQDESHVSLFTNRMTATLPAALPTGRVFSCPPTLFRLPRVELWCSTVYFQLTSTDPVSSPWVKPGFVPLLCQLVTGNSWALVWGYREVSV